MKKILFLSFSFPYGHFGPSDQCTTKIMEALVQTGKYDVHNISYAGSVKNYKKIDGITIHTLDYPEAVKKRPRWLIHLLLLLKLPLYPYTQFFSSRKAYRKCLPIVQFEHFDLVVAQCNPEESVLVGTWLKKNGYIDHLMILFWDSIYGKLPRRFIPKSFALRRQQKAEESIAQCADALVSLYPLKQFHEEYGDVPSAVDKRVYLGIPSLKRPPLSAHSSYEKVIDDGKINMLYSGTIFRTEYVSYLVELLNKTKYNSNINLIFFCRGVDESVFEECRKNFKGTIYSSGWIPIDDLLALYPKVNYFLSFPGNPTAICSKVYEYMSYGKPLIILYDDDSDVNVRTFSRYPVCLSIDERLKNSEQIDDVENYLENTKESEINFEKVEELYPLDTVSAYTALIERFV